MNFTHGQFDAFGYYKVDKYLSEYGLCVHPDYRGRGIATEMLIARGSLLKALGLEMSSTAFTVIGSQIAAERAGYELNYEIDYADLEVKFPNFDFSHAKVKSYKIMSLKVDL